MPLSRPGSLLLVVATACGATPAVVPPPASPPVASTSSTPSAPAAVPAATDVAPASPPSLDAVLAAAAAEHKPVLLDFWAVWCKPCAELRVTMEKPEVKAALAPFHVQLYKVDDGAEGSSASDRFGAARAGIPLLVALGPDGAEIDRAQSWEAATLVPWLSSRAPIAARGALTAERMKGETDALTLLLGAHAADRDDAPDRAEALLQAARAADPKDARGIASQAEFEALKYQARRDEKRLHGTLLLDYAKAHPDRPFAFAALQGIAALPVDARPSRAQLGAVVAAVRRENKASAALVDSLPALLGLPAPERGKESAQPTPAALLVDPLAPAPPSSADGMPPEVKAAMRQSMAIQTRIGEACKDLPHPADAKVEPMRVWVDKTSVTRALLLDPESEPSLKACLEAAARTVHDAPEGWGAVQQWDIPVQASAH
jgi:thioredoxin-like negative regulator of GroEL